MILKEGWGGVDVRFLKGGGILASWRRVWVCTRHVIRCVVYEFSEDVDESWMASTICTHRCTVNEGGKVRKYPVYAIDFGSTSSVVIRI